MIIKAFVLSLLVMLLGCTPVKTQVTNQYQLSAANHKHLTKGHYKTTLLVSPPEAAADLQTEQMLYIKKPFQIEAFAQNSWTSPPASMLHPLLVESLQCSGHFYAVTSSPYSEGADYRLDTQLLHLEQSFLHKPSVLIFSAKVVLTHSKTNKLIASRIFKKRIPCPQDTPYGGVLAANQATRWFTACVTAFVVRHVHP